MAKSEGLVVVGNNGRMAGGESAPRVFPLPGTTLYQVTCNQKFKEEFHSKLKIANRVVIPLYRIGLLPLLGLSKSIMLLTTKGRKSGKLRSFPVGYSRIGNCVYVFSAWGKRANWYKNLVASPEDVYVQIGLRRFHARAQVMQDPEELKGILKQFVLESPDAAHRLMGWDPERDDPANSDFALMIEKVLTVRFAEC